MFDLGGDLVVDDRLLIFTNNIDAEFEMVLGLEFVGFRLAIFGRQAVAIDKGAV